MKQLRGNDYVNHITNGYSSRLSLHQLLGVRLLFLLELGFELLASAVWKQLS